MYGTDFGSVARLHSRQKCDRAPRYVNIRNGPMRYLVKARVKPGREEDLLHAIRDQSLEGRIVKDGVRKAVKDRQLALEELVKAIAEFRKFSDQPLTLRGGDYARAVQALNSRARDSSKHNCTHCVACRHMCFTLLLSSIIDCSQRLIQ
jgi:hypothetical protein